jgi:glucose/arabinose dehydrogenase
MRRRLYRATTGMALALGVVAGVAPPAGAQQPPGSRVADPADVDVPAGYELEVVAEGLSYATDVAFDDAGNVYVSEAGGHTYGTSPEKAPPPRILRLTEGGGTEVVYDAAPPLPAIAQAAAEDLPPGLVAPITGITWHDGLLYVAHRTRVSTLDPETGEFTTIIDGLPAWGEFQNNKVVFGPGGRMYFFVSTQGNSGPVGDHMLKVLTAYNKPNQSEVPCEDVTLTGVNFTHPNPFTPDPNDTATYDAYVEFGKDVPPGTTIEGKTPCNGAFFSAMPDGSDLQLVAWGLRSDFGYRFAEDGRLISTQNSCNPIPPRPVFDAPEAIYEIEEGAWYGWPDYCAGIPITDERFRAPDPSDPKIAPENLEFVLTEETRQRLLDGRTEPIQPLTTLTPHVAAEGFVFGRDQFGVDPEDILLAEFGTVVTYQADQLPGFRVERVDLETGETEDFLVNKTRMPASATGGRGLERPIQLDYAPDGSLYLVDFGVIDVDQDGLNAHPNTGVVWRMVRTGQVPVGGIDAGAGSTQGLEHASLLVAGGAALLTSGALALLVVRRRRGQPPA